MTTLNRVAGRPVAAAVLFLLAAAGCSQAVRTAPADPYASTSVADADASTAVAEARQIQIPEGLLSHAQSAGSRYAGNYYAPISGSAAPGPRAASAYSGATGGLSASASASPAASFGRMAQVRVYNAVVGPPPVAGGAGIVAYQPQVAAIPVGATLVVQATASADLRYVNMNVQPQLVGTPTFTQFPINFGF